MGNPYATMDRFDKLKSWSLFVHGDVAQNIVSAPPKIPRVTVARPDSPSVPPPTVPCQLEMADSTSGSPLLRLPWHILEQVYDYAAAERRARRAISDKPEIRLQTVDAPYGVKDPRCGILSTLQPNGDFQMMTLVMNRDGELAKTMEPCTKIFLLRARLPFEECTIDIRSSTGA